jgi:hypothetical protein
MWKVLGSNFGMDYSMPLESSKVVSRDWNRLRHCQLLVCADDVNLLSGGGNKTVRL